MGGREWAAEEDFYRWWPRRLRVEVSHAGKGGLSSAAAAVGLSSAGLSAVATDRCAGLSPAAALLTARLMI